MAETIVKIFVQFADPESVDKAREALGGRFFSGTGSEYNFIKVKLLHYSQMPLRNILHLEAIVMRI